MFHFFAEADAVVTRAYHQWHSRAFPFIEQCASLNKTQCEKLKPDLIHVFEASEALLA